MIPQNTWSSFNWSLKITDCRLIDPSKVLIVVQLIAQNNWSLFNWSLKITDFRLIDPSKKTWSSFSWSLKITDFCSIDRSKVTNDCRLIDRSKILIVVLIDRSKLLIVVQLIAQNNWSSFYRWQYFCTLKSWHLT